jgi:hypothetical protein
MLCVRNPHRFLFAAVLLVLIGAASVAFAAHGQRKLAFVAYVAANPDPHGCLGGTGLYVDLQANLAKPPNSVAEFQKIAAENVPSSPVLIVARTSYPLTLERSTSLIGNQQVGWNFRRVDVSATRAKQLIHARAAIRYRIGSQSFTAKTQIDDGRCKSLI